jgi:hypothetical protein
MDRGDVEKDQQFNGFRQTWTERTDSVFHGPYTVYWEAGPTVCLRGQYVAGSQEGIWTYWNRDGTLDRQILFRHDQPAETRTGPPWFDDAEDHRSTDDLG